MSDVQIYVIHHDGENYPTFESENIIPILAGNPVRDGYRIALRDTAGGQCITDQEQQDIYSEFTAYYYIWKNKMPKDKKGYVGVMHYRSFLNLAGETPGLCPTLEARLGFDINIVYQWFKEGSAITYPGRRAPAVCGLDAVVSDPIEFPSGIYNQYDQCHPMADILFPRAKALLAQNPKYAPMVDYFDEHFSLGNYAGKCANGYFKCLLVSTWEYFDAYCQFIFYILDSLFADKEVRRQMNQYQMIKGPDRSDTQKITRFRLLAFFAERMTSFFIGYAIKHGPFRIGQAKRLHFTSMQKLVKYVYPTYPDEKDLTPMVRAYSIQEQDHMAVSDFQELDTMGKKGYFCEGPLGYIYTKQVPDSSPVYRIEKKNGEHYLTQDLAREKKQNTYKSSTLLGYSKNSYKISTQELLHLEEYVLVGQAGGPVPTINPSEFPVIGYDPNRPYADKMGDFGFLVDMWARKYNQ